MSSPADGSSIRGFWFGQVSEAANALAGTGVLSNTPAATKISTELIEPIKSSVRPDDSFNPAKSHVRSGPQLTIFICLMTTLAVATIILLVTGELSFTGIRQRVASVIDGLSPAAERTAPRLIIQLSYGTVNEPAPLGLAVQGLAEEAVVYIEGLLPGMELSAGRPVGADAWEIPATEIDYAWIAPPQGFVGTVKLIAKLRLPDNQIADRQAIDVAWQSPISAAPPLRQRQEDAAMQAFSQPDRDQAVSSQKRITAGERLDGEEFAVEPSIASAPRHRGDQHEELPSKLLTSTLRQTDSNGIGRVSEPIQLTEIVRADQSPSALQRHLDDAEVILLLKRGKDLIASGDLAAARLVLQRAADANYAEAALALGATYDPLVLRELKVYGFTPDAAMARVWYEKAVELGSPAAPRRLEILTEGTRTR
jgi:hypothetical protein